MHSTDKPGVGPIERFMAEDHTHIDRWLAAAQLPDGSVDPTSYARFRQALLRHIGMEEKVLLPYARAKRGGEGLPLASLLRADHGDIARLLTHSPSGGLLAVLLALLERHNALEEGPEGLYAICDALAGAEAFGVVDRLRAQPEVPLARFYDGPSHGGV